MLSPDPRHLNIISVLCVCYIFRLVLCYIIKISVQELWNPCITAVIHRCQSETYFARRKVSPRLLRYGNLAPENMRWLFTREFTGNCWLVIVENVFMSWGQRMLYRLWVHLKRFTSSHRCLHYWTQKVFLRQIPSDSIVGCLSYVYLDRKKTRLF